jgi:hypothetical protein
MARVDFPHEHRFGLAYIRQRLFRLGFREENDEIDWMAIPQADANLGLALEAADAAAVPGARIDDDPGAAVFTRRHCPFRRVNAHQRVVDRVIEFAAVDDHVVVESENRLEAFRLAYNAGIAALAKRIEKKSSAARNPSRIRKMRRQHAVRQISELIPATPRPPHALSQPAGV